MKNKHSLLLLILFILSYSSSQAQINKITYQRTSLKNIDIAVLYYNDTLSFFNYGKFIEEKDVRKKETIRADGSKNTTINSSDTLGVYQLLNTSIGKIYERRVTEEKSLIIEEELTPLDWQLMDSTQKIGNYTCQLASTFCYGRTFYAWYTSEIPSDKAPWKLGGLPGLVLYAYDKENQFTWKATNIEFDVEFDFLPYFPTQETITLAQYYQQDEEALQKMIRAMETIAAQGGGTVEFDIKKNFIEKEPKR